MVSNIVLGSSDPGSIPGSDVFCFQLFILGIIAYSAICFVVI